MSPLSWGGGTNGKDPKWHVRLGLSITPLIPKLRIRIRKGQPDSGHIHNNGAYTALGFFLGGGEEGG